MLINCIIINHQYYRPIKHRLDLLNGVTKIIRQSKMENFTAALEYWPCTSTVKINYFFGGHFSTFKLNYEIFSLFSFLNNFGDMFGPFQIDTDY